jgi:UDP-N-acetyl-D-galactosamine dehydrogenase
MQKEIKIVVVGLGYVGLPLALELAKKYQVIGFDVKKERIDELKNGFDRTDEVNAEILRSSSIRYFSNPQIIKDCNFIIVAVPTPVGKGNVPDLNLVEKATNMIAENLSSGSIVVYESTVYPGVTEEICLPILEKISGLKGGSDFKVGYSPERINPGDKEHAINKVVKIVSGMDDESLEVISMVYSSITQVHKAPSIKVAEAAKVIENTQRDLNIALMNELALIFNKLDISIYDVLRAAETKWNFLKFYPGLVGGHCIGVDPYYLTYKAQMLGYQPEVILSGRKINDAMGKWIVEQVIKKACMGGHDLSKLKVLICGITFKENVPDVRNSKVVDMYNELLEFGIKADVYDPVADKHEVSEEYAIDTYENIPTSKYDIIMVAVPHVVFQRMAVPDWKKIMINEGSLFVDIKGIFSKKELEAENVNYWSL